MRFREPLILALLILLVLGGLAGLTWMNYRFSVRNPGGNDFLARWMGARKWLMEGISPYDQSVSQATQEMLYGRPANPQQGESLGFFFYPLTSMIFYAPFGLLEYFPARAVWMTVLELSLVASVLVSMRLVRWKPKPVWIISLILFGLLWYHGVRTIILGGFAPIEALLVVGALYLILKDKDLGAGILLALSTSQPQMTFLLIPFVLIWAYSRRRFSLIRNFLISLLALFVLSLLFMPNWPIQMLWQWIDLSNYSARIGLLTSIIASAVPGLRSRLNIGMQIALWLYLFVEWVGAWKKEIPWFLWTAMMTLVITNFVVIPPVTTHYVVLLPVLLLIFKVWRQRWGTVGNWVVGLVLIFLLIGLWYFFLSTVEGNMEHPAMYLPVPLFSLFGLWWVRWWAIHPVQLPSDEQLVEL
jgi:hypothetical protein